MKGYVMLAESQRTVLALVRSMSIQIGNDPTDKGIPLYQTKCSLVYAIAAYDTLECWQLVEGEVMQLDSIDPPATLPALFSKLAHWSHTSFIMGEEA